MAVPDFSSREFDDAVRAAYDRALRDTLAAGSPAFYIENGLNVMELPDGQRFEIEWVPDAPSGENFRPIGKLGRRAA